jgi:hypothetical protein
MVGPRLSILHGMSYTIPFIVPINMYCRPEAERAVSGFSNAIHRGYATLADAQSAFAYAQARGWIRSTRAVTASIAMPMPTPNNDDSDEFNPLSGTEEVDNT